jgi:hypothetical protein
VGERTSRYRAPKGSKNDGSDMKIPKEVSDYMSKIGSKGGKNGRGIKKRKAGALGGIASGKVRAKKALANQTKPL